jgi:hypothetical protein
MEYNFFILEINDLLYNYFEQVAPRQHLYEAARIYQCSGVRLSEILSAS